MSKIFDEAGYVNTAFLELAKGVGLEIPDRSTFADLNTILQQKWRQEGKLRSEIKGRPAGPKEQELLFHLGCMKEIHVPDDLKECHGALLLGSLLPAVRRRLSFLISESNRGIRVPRVYALGNERLLNPAKESEQALNTPADGLTLRDNWRPEDRVLPTCEIDMMTDLLLQSKLPHPWPIWPIRTPGMGNTDETFNQWRAMNPFDNNKGTYIVVSNQPYVDQQTSVARRMAPAGMTIYGIGPAANPVLPLETFLDNFAKEVYELNQVQ